MKNALKYVYEYWILFRNIYMFYLIDYTNFLFGDFVITEKTIN